MSIQKVSGLISVATLVFSGVAFGQTQVPHSFQAGQPARAAEVNANFDALETAVDQNAAAIQSIPAGPQGDPGPQGSAGPQGVQGTQGATGSQGSQGIQGLQGDTGPQGPIGPEGSAGGPVEAGSIGLAEIDPTQVQIRVGGTCSEGSFIAAVAEDGSVTCSTGTDPGSYNTRYGLDTLISNTTGVDNIAIGPYALYSNTEGYSNTAVGASPLWQNTTGVDNTAIGWCAMCSNTTGLANTAIGYVALYSNTTGVRNTAIGLAMYDNTTGVHNTAIGFEALNNNTGGHSNTVLGAGAGLMLTTGNNNIVIGADIYGVAGESGTTRIGSSAGQTRAFIGGIRGVTTGNANAINVVIDSAGQLGTVSSSRRYKQDIADMGQASDRLLQLRPVTFRYKEAYENGEQPLDYGLIAEEVAEVFPELVVLNKENQPETVKYRLLSSLLLNELQKQAGEVAELKAQMAELSKLVGRK